MSTTRPATTPSNENSARARLALDITFLLGPPTRGVDAIAFSEVAEDRGLTREEFWIQVVRRNLGQLLEFDSEGRSSLDNMFSKALGESVTVWEVEGKVSLQVGRRFPGLVVRPHEVLDDTGHPTTQNLADRATLGRIADGLMEFTRAEWTVCTIVGGGSEVCFPFMNEDRYGAHDA